MITQCSSDPDVKGYKGQSVLHFACIGGSVSLVQTLIREYKVDVNARDDNNDTPLCLAAKAGKVEVALALITQCSNDLVTRVNLFSIVHA